MKKGILYSAIVLIALGLVIGVSVYRKKGAARRRVTAKKAAGLKSTKGEPDIRSAVINVAEKTGKAVVAISTERTQRIGFRSPRSRPGRFGPGGPFAEEDPFERFFEEFFGQFPEREFKQRGLGSGFIIDREGHILTNHHVIEGAEIINVTLADGRNFKGVPKGSDPVSDLAVVKINAKDLHAAKLGNSNRLRVGEWVVALGNPFGHLLKSAKPTVTVGVVSALHRRIPVPGGAMGYLDMIQTDAAVNPGNSGGPLCDLNGNVIGINVVIFSTSGGHQGVSFAIPINTAKDIVGDLIKGKEIAYGWLGVSVQEITPEIKEYFKLPDRKGALISEVTPDGPAEKAGMKAGDIVKTFNGKEVTLVYDLLREVGSAGVGHEVRLEIIRDRSKKTIKVKIGKRAPAPGLEEEKDSDVARESMEWRGARAIDITEKIAQELKLKNREAVVIITVDPMSASYAAGLRKGDVLRDINELRVKNLADYGRIAQAARGAALVRTDRGYFVVKEDGKKGQKR